MDDFGRRNYVHSSDVTGTRDCKNENQPRHSIRFIGISPGVRNGDLKTYSYKKSLRRIFRDFRAHIFVA